MKSFINQNLSQGTKRRNILLSNPNTSVPSRRSFLKTTALFTLGSLVLNNSFAEVLDKKGDIALIVAPDDAIANAIPPTWALGELKTALETQGSTIHIVARIADVAVNEYCVLASGIKTSLAQLILNQSSLTAPTEPESLCLFQAGIQGRQVLLAAGTDERGLVYALTELADRVQCLATGRSALEFAEPVIERPASRIRSMLRGFNSEIEDKVWFYDQAFWRSYLTMLVTSRINRLSFAMGMGYNSVNRVTDGYLVFPYPFFVAISGFDVHAKGLSNEERIHNLATLKFIGEECARRGLDLQLGIWTLAYKYNNSPNVTYLIEGLTDSTHAAYCRDALAVILREVPAVTGITFRVHSESGIPKGNGSFWKTQFSAIEECGRRVEIDMHAKNMEPETLEAALATGQPTVVSPKYCGEHMALPYHQASIRDFEMVPADEFTDTGSGILIGNRLFTRYGYADFLAENRTWDVVFRIWPGTQRFLLNGDPAIFAGYGRNAAFCGAAGIELSEPLHFKGRMGSGIAGGRCAYADLSLAPRYGFEKYLYTYRLWGRLGYNPNENPEVWRRSLNRTFGSAATAVENALAPISRVLPLITLAHAPSADCMIYWPEIYTNMPIADTNTKQPYHDTQSPKLFGNASSFDPQLFQSPDECGDTLVAGRASGKYSPLEVAQWLEDIADTALTHITSARSQLGASASTPEFRRVEEDVLIQRGLALFFAGKLRCAVLWRIYTLTGNPVAGDAALARYTEGREAWATMAERAKGIYRSDITYGTKTLCGHWLDRIPAFDEDIADLRTRLKIPVTPAAKVDPVAAGRVLKIVNAKPIRPSVSAQHVPATRFRSDQPLSLSLHIKSRNPRRVMLYYRHVNEAERWQSVVLMRKGNVFQGEIPADYTDKRYPLQYYFEVETGPAEATLLPLLASDLANVPYYVVRQGR